MGLIYLYLHLLQRQDADGREGYSQFCSVRLPYFDLTVARCKPLSLIINLPAAKSGQVSFIYIAQYHTFHNHKYDTLSLDPPFR